jgi:hypothetical protein
MFIDWNSINFYFSFMMSTDYSDIDGNEIRSTAKYKAYTPNFV